jgi:O-succinylbenzoic acid--CoA ligase
MRLGIRPDDRWLLPLPLFHVGGLAVLTRSAIYGTTADVHVRFDADAVADALASGHVTLCSLVPTMLARLLGVWGDRPVPDSFRAILLGGGPIAPHLLQRAGEIGLRVAPSYGLTEAASQVATAVPSHSWPGSDIAARPLPFSRLRVVDEAGADVPASDVGEILVAGPTVMAGYWRQPEATARALSGGWLHTGDVGWLDDDGRLHVADRRDDLIVSGGENVYPAEVEAVLMQHPDVAEAGVVGVPDEAWGQRVIAVIVRRNADLNEAELAAHAREHLAGYKVPREFVWVNALPRTAAGKLRRGVVRAVVAADLP